MARGLADEVQRTGARLARNVHVLFRTEHLIARRRLTVARNRGALMATAGVVAAIGVAMANVALFFWLAGSFGYSGAGAILAAGNLVLAGVLLAVALRMSAEQELTPAVEMRDLMLSEIEADIHDGLTEAKALTDNVKRIASDPLGAVTPGLLAPLLSALVKAVKK